MSSCCEGACGVDPAAWLLAGLRRAPWLAAAAIFPSPTAHLTCLAAAVLCCVQVVHADGNEEVEVTPYPKVFLGDVSSQLMQAQG